MEKRDLKRRPTYEYRCDERLKTKVEGSTRLSYTGLSEGLDSHVTGTSKDKDEVNKGEVLECDGCVYDLESIGGMLPTLDLRLELFPTNFKIEQLCWSHTTFRASKRLFFPCFFENEGPVKREVEVWSTTLRSKER